MVISLTLWQSFHKKRHAEFKCLGDIIGSSRPNTIFCPTEDVVADLDFVHGLGGGSRSIWTKSVDLELY